MGPLSHIRVLDLTIARAGPSAVRLLADWGADVIRVEPPAGKVASVTGARRGADEQNLHRNKRSLTIDLKHPQGHGLFAELASKADVVVENFKAEVKHRLKVDYETIKAINPSIIYASISGFGQDGPYGERGGVDQIIQGMSGLMSVTGEPGRGPMRVGVAISDTSAGMFLGQGILLALLHRERTGEGQWVHTSLLEAMMSKLDFQGARYTMTGEVPDQQGNDHPYHTPMGTFRSKDGLVNLAASSGRLWQRFCAALDADVLSTHPDYQNARDRMACKDQLKADITAVTSHYTTDELVEKLNAVGVPCGPINTIKEAFDDPQVRHLGMVKPAPHPELGDLNLVRSPINLSLFPHEAAFNNAAPDPGSDSEAVLTDLGFAADRIDAMKSAGVIYVNSMNTGKLTVAQRLGYGVGDLGINLYFIAAMTYLPFFYTDVFGLSAAVAGGVFLVARVIDAVTDPMMGMIAERTRSKWGRLRPHIRYGALPLGLISILTFTTPDLSEGGKIWWAYSTYILFGIAYTVVSIPYSALTASLTSDHRERTVLSTVRMAFAFAGGYIISVGMLPFVGLFETPEEGFRSALILFAIVATVLLWLTVANTQERVTPPASQKLALSDSFKAVFANPPLMVVIVLFTCGMLSFTIRQSVTLYYFKYNLGREDLIALFFGITLPVMFVGLLAVPKLAARFGKAGGIIVGAIVTMFGSIGLYFTPYDSVALIFVWGCVVALGGTPIAVLGWAMIPDTVEYAQWRMGLRADGAIFAFASFFQKLAKALGGAGVLGVMALTGYAANVEQSAVSLRAIHALMTLAPIGIMIVMIVAARAYRLDEAAHQEIVKALSLP